MTNEITQNPVKACVFLGGVPLRFALGSSVELGTRSLYAQFAYICYQAIPADDDVDPLSRLGLYSLSGQTNTLPSELRDSMPRVRIVVPNHNHARFLRRCVESVLRQTFHDFEVFLLDDCSTDDSRSLLSSYADDPRVRIEFNEVNSGITFKQWNKGVGLARGEYVWIAESDDYADERMLERLEAVLEAQPKVAFAYCRHGLFPPTIG